MRFVEKSLSQHGQPAFVLEGEGGGRFIAKNLVGMKKGCTVCKRMKGLGNRPFGVYHYMI